MLIGCLLSGELLRGYGSDRRTSGLCRGCGGIRRPCHLLFVQCYCTPPVDTARQRFSSRRVLLAPNRWGPFGARTASFHVCSNLESVRLNSAHLWHSAIAFLYAPSFACSFCLQRAFSELQPQVILRKINFTVSRLLTLPLPIAIAIAIACCSTASLCL